MPVKLRIIAVVAPLVLLVDQVSKLWITRTLAPDEEELPIIPGLLSFVHAQNPGAAFGMLDDFEHRVPVFVGFTVLAVVLLWQMYRQIADEDRLQAGVVGLVLAGGLGNFVDRVHKQSVTDFIRVYTEHPSLERWLVARLGTAEWPTFNVADVAIVSGVGLYLAHYFWVERPRARLAPPAAPAQGEA